MSGPSRSLRFLAPVMALLGLGGAAPAAEPSPPDDASDPAIAQFVAWQEAHALPALMLEPAGPARPEPGGSRVGGPVWLPAGEAWPLDGAGKRLTFLAQIDFAAMPPLPDFPTSGVLQFFIGSDDLYGADFDHPERGTFKVIYRESLAGPGRLETGPVSEGERYVDDFSPLAPEIAGPGIALTAVARPHWPTIGNWWADRDLGLLLADSTADRIFTYLDTAQADRFGLSHVGGHPEFTQSDWRANPPYQDVDRVLLNLWSDIDGIMWGDSGQGQFLIRREDLLKRDFSKVFYQWDCY